MVAAAAAAEYMYIEDAVDSVVGSCWRTNAVTQ